MMNMSAVTNRTGTAQPLAERVSLGSYTTYAEAQSVVDYLADHHFEVQHAQIVGSDLRMVEQITGRLTWPRALLSGVAGGAWLGVLVGVLLSILADATFLAAMAWGLGWGMLFGGGFGAVRYLLSGGRRDFTSRSGIVASRFEVLVVAGYDDHARTVLASAALS
jgi:hypothetical protein